MKPRCALARRNARHARRRVRRVAHRTHCRSGRRSRSACQLRRRLPHAVELGRLLFWDPILSGNKDTACATCHHPDFAYADGRDLSRGTGSVGLGPARVDASKGQIPVVKRNSPPFSTPPSTASTRGAGQTAISREATLASVDQARAPMFWDSRVRSLETAGARADQGARRDARPRLSGSRGGRHGRRAAQADPGVRRAVPGTPLDRARRSTAAQLGEADRRLRTHRSSR